VAVHPETAIPVPVPFPVFIRPDAPTGERLTIVTPSSVVRNPEPRQLKSVLPSATDISERTSSTAAVEEPSSTVRNENNVSTYMF
jgi:hypothetical protein